MFREALLLFRSCQTDIFPNASPLLKLAVLKINIIKINIVKYFNFHCNTEILN